MSRTAVVIGAVLTLSALPQNQVVGSGALIWKDATGEIVTGVIGSIDRFGDTALYVLDSAGYLWRLDSSTLQISVAYSTYALQPEQSFRSIDCTGTAYFLSLYIPYIFPAPRMTLTVPRDPMIRVRPDDVAEELVSRCSYMAESGCARWDPCEAPQRAIRACRHGPAKTFDAPNAVLRGAAAS